MSDGARRGCSNGLLRADDVRASNEPSLRIITQRPPGSAPCIQGVAERLPLRDKCFEGSLARFTIHHWSDASAGLHELCRVTRERIVLFTLDPEFDTNLWLASDYLPEVLELDRPRFPTLEKLEGILGSSFSADSAGLSRRVHRGKLEASSNLA